MFNKLFRDIYLPIVLISAVLVLFIDIIAIAMLTDTLKDTYNDLGQKRVARAFDSCELYISSASATTYNLSLDNTVIEELASPAGRSVVDRLDSTCNYSLKINGICAYSASGAVYVSSGLAQVPGIEDLKQVDGIAAFLEGEDDEYISFRTEQIAGIYNNVAYPDEMGVITCCRKVYRDGEVVGWIFTDILPSNLYGYVFSNGQFNNAFAFITANDVFFKYGDNAEHMSLLSGNYGGYFKYRKEADSGLFAVTVFDSTEQYTSQIILLSCILIAVTLLLLVGVHFAARATAKSVTVRLDQLAEKMKKQELP